MSSQKPPVVTDLQGVGPKLAEKLAALGISQVSDLLFHLPIRYEDRTRIHPIGSIRPGQRVLLEGRVEQCAVVRARRPMLVVVLFDGTGRVTLRFFHFRYYQQQQLAKGARLRCFGEVRAGFQGLELIHPSYKRQAGESPEPLADRLTPVYPSAEGLGQKQWIRMTDQALALLQRGALKLEELLPQNLLAQMRLQPLAPTLHFIHRPPADADVAALVVRDHPAQKRLALEELLAHNLGMQKLRLLQRARSAPVMPPGDAAETAFMQGLPFALTGAQQRVTGEIHKDLESDKPMLRLVHGDVGSGKTVMAAIAALRATDNGYQTAITAPTELLAEQHFQTFSDWLLPLGITPVWLSGKVTGKKRSEALERISNGAPIVIGTHALMQKGVEFQRLGLVIVDEQHRFGVDQRMDLL